MTINLHEYVPPLTLYLNIENAHNPARKHIEKTNIKGFSIFKYSMIDTKSLTNNKWYGNYIPVLARQCLCYLPLPCGYILSTVFQSSTPLVSESSPNMRHSVRAVDKLLKHSLPFSVFRHLSVCSRSFSQWIVFSN